MIADILQMWDSLALPKVSRQKPQFLDGAPVGLEGTPSFGNAGQPYERLGCVTLELPPNP